MEKGPAAQRNRRINYALPHAAAWSAGYGWSIVLGDLNINVAGEKDRKWMQ